MWIRSRSEIAAAVLAALLATQAARAQQPPAEPDAQTLARARDDFARGMKSFEASQYREAIDVWLQVFETLGPVTGYRVAYNLGVAYELLGDATGAADFYGRFLQQVDARRDAHEALAKEVIDDEREARGRLAGLQATKGRLAIDRGGAAIGARIDSGEPRPPGYLAYVTPGHHRVRFVSAAGKEDVQDVDVAAGEIRHVAPNLPIEAPPPATTTTAPPPAPRPARIEMSTRSFVVRDRPFSPIVLYAAAGVTIVSAIVPALEYKHALDLKSQHDNSTDPGERANIESSYDSARATAYLTLAIPIGLAVASGILATLYFVAPNEHEAGPTVPFVTPVQNGGLAGVHGRF